MVRVKTKNYTNEDTSTLILLLATKQVTQRITSPRRGHHDLLANQEIKQPNKIHTCTPIHNINFLLRYFC